MGTLLWANEEWRRFGREAGLDDDWSLGQNYFDVCARAYASGDEIAGTILTGLRAIATGAGSTVDNTYPCDTPQRRLWFRLTARPVPENPSQILVFHQDITELVDTRVANTLMSQRESAAVLVAGLTHDLNNMLQAVIGNLELGRMRGAWEQYGPNAQAAAERSADLVRRIRAAARRTVETHRVHFDLVEAVQDVATLVGGSLDRRVRLEADLPQQPVPVYAERAAVEHALLNLVLNARDALIQQPPAADPRVLLQVRDDDDSCEVLVSDNGPGIPPEHRDAIFTPFFTTKATSGGSGLGLFMARSSLLAQGGELALLDRSSLGGATFRLTLPRAT